MPFAQFAMQPLDRYFSEQPISGETVRLSGVEAHHLIHVMRAKPGEKVILFDGRGGEWLAEIRRIARTQAELALLSYDAIDRENPFTITIATPLPKGDRQRWLVEKAVELGVAQLVPLRTARSVAQPGDSAPAKLARYVIEASKQCGRNRLMQIAPPVSWPEFVRQTQGISRRFVAHPAGRDNAGAQPKDFRSLAEGVPLSPTDAVVVAIGPEGGFTPDEIALAVAAGWAVVDLGPRILRVETAALVMVVLAVDHFCGHRT